jgi:hypothetical protein
MENYYPVLVHYFSQKMYDILTDDIFKMSVIFRNFYFDLIENRVISLRSFVSKYRIFVCIRYYLSCITTNTRCEIQLHQRRHNDERPNSRGS